MNKVSGILQIHTLACIISFNLKKGWKLQSVEYAKKTWQKSEEIKNGGRVPVSGGAGFGVTADVKNTKTGQMETVVVYFK